MSVECYLVAIFFVIFDLEADLFRYRRLVELIGLIAIFSMLADIPLTAGFSLNLTVSGPLWTARIGVCRGR